MFAAPAAEDDDADEKQQDDDSRSRADGGDHVQRQRRRGAEGHEGRSVALLVGDEALVVAEVRRPEATRRRRWKQARGNEFAARYRVPLKQLRGWNEKR